MSSMAKSFVSGFSAPWRGVRYIALSPSLWIWAVLPFLLNAILVALAFSWAFQNLADFVYSVTSFLGIATYKGVLALIFFYFLKIFLWVVFFIFVSFGAYVFGQIISAPFSAVLAEKSLIKLKVIPDRAFNFKFWLVTSVKMMRVSIVKGVLFLFIGAILFLLGFVPVVNILVPFALLLILAFDSADYSFENLHMNLRERLAFFRKNIVVFSGYSAALGIVMFVPGLNFFLFPASVVASSLLISQTKDQIKDQNVER